MKRYGVIYRITNLLNNKCYIGLTTADTAWKRFLDHHTKYSSKMYIDLAMRKHGLDNFKVEEIYSCFDWQELNEKEDYFINLENTRYPNGYNLKGGGQKGRHTEESKRRIKEALKTKKGTGMLGKKHSAETKLKLSKAFTQNNDKIVAIHKDNGSVIIFNSLYEVTLKGFHRSNVLSILRERSNRKYDHNHTFIYFTKYANQSGSLDSKDSRHAQRIDLEPVNNRIE